MAQKNRPAAKKTATAAAAAPAQAAAPETTVTSTATKIPGGFKTKAIPLSQLNDNANKDMSAEAISARRSAAQRSANRMPRTTTAHERVKDIKVEKAGEGEETADGLLRRIYSGRGEYVTRLASGVTVELKRSDLVRQLKMLPPDAKSPMKMVKSETDDLVHILS